jgi:hypothetical protein
VQLQHNLPIGGIAREDGHIRLRVGVQPQLKAAQGVAVLVRLLPLTSLRERTSKQQTTRQHKVFCRLNLTTYGSEQHVPRLAPNRSSIARG